MKHVITDDVNVNVRVDIPTEELEGLVEKVVDGTITIIVVATVAHIFKEWVT